MKTAMVMQVVGWMWSATGERTTSNLDPAVVLSVPASIKISKSPGLYRIDCQVLEEALMMSPAAAALRIFEAKAVVAKTWIGKGCRDVVRGR